MGDAKIRISLRLGMSICQYKGDMQPNALGHVEGALESQQSIGQIRMDSGGEKHTRMVGLKRLGFHPTELS